jgi:nucleotide-binding universal stress UspA family protein
MVEITRVLCAVDFSDFSRYALHHALAVSKWYSSRLTVLHVIDPVVLLQPGILMAEFGPSVATEADIRAVRDRLDTWLGSAVASGVPTDVIVREGNPARQILKCAESLTADLIVLGTHGRGGFERFVVGSVAEKVLRKSPRPVLTIPAGMPNVARPPYRHLLCPVDFSESSLAALRFALSIAEESDAELTILHAIDWPADSELLVERFDDPLFRTSVEQDVRIRLDALVDDTARQYCSPKTDLTFGKPYRAILEAAERLRTDLIVMGVAGRNPIDLTLFGSTTNHVVRRALCPVLTLRN